MHRISTERVGYSDIFSYFRHVAVDKIVISLPQGSHIHTPKSSNLLHMTHNFHHTCLVLSTAFVVSVATAQADYWSYSLDAGVTPAAKVVAGKKYLLQTGKSLNAGQYAFLAGRTYSYTNAAFNNDNTFLFVATGKNDKSGSPIFYLQRSNGEYLAQPDSPQPFTTSTARAWEVVVKPAVHIDRDHTFVSKAGTASEKTLKGFEAYVEEAREKKGQEDFSTQTATYQSTDVVEDGVVIAAATPEAADDALSSYKALTSADILSQQATDLDNNLWYLYEATPLKGAAALTAAASLIQSQLSTALLQRDFPTGNGGGLFSPTAYSRFKAVWDVAAPIANGEKEATESQANSLVEQLENTFAQLRASRQPLTGGYYIFTNYRQHHDAASADHGSALYDGSLIDATETHAKWSGSGEKTPNYDATAPLSYETAKFIWELVPAGKEHFYLRNYESKLYLGAYDETTRSLSMSLQPVAYSYAENASAPGYLSLTTRSLPTTAGQPSALLAQDGTSLSFGSPQGQSATGWQARPLTESAVEKMRKESEQPALNNKLSQLLQKVAITFTENQVFSPVDEQGNKLPSIFDNQFTTPDGLFTDVQQVSIPMLDPTEGNNLSALLDGDANSYVHTTYHDEVPWDAPHFLQLTLDKPTNGLTFKLRKREHGNANVGSPSQVVLWGTNDAKALEVTKKDSTTAEGQTLTNYEAWKTAGWTKLSDTHFSYLDESTGFANFTYDGNYRYYRMEVLNKVGEPADHGKYFFASELRVYHSVYDKSASPIESVDAGLLHRLQSTIDVANAELQAGKAQQSTVEQLEALYARLIENLPDVDRFLDAYTFFNGYMRSAKVAPSDEPNKLGYYNKDVRAKVIAQYRELRPIIQKAQLGTVPSQKEMAEAIQTFKRLYKEYQTGLNTPAEGIYRIASAEPANAIAAHTYLAAANSSQLPEQSIRLLGTKISIAGTDTTAVQESDVDRHLEFLWQLQKVEGGFTLRNLFTGLYLSHIPNHNDVVQSTIPVILQLAGAGEGAFHLLLGTDDEAFRYVQAQHVHRNGTVAVLGGQTYGRNLAAFEFKAVDQSDLDKLFGDNGEGLRYNLPEQQAFHILTLPFAINVKKEDGFFTVVGQQPDTKDIVLRAAEGDLPAGTPHIYHNTKESVVTLYPAATRFADFVTTNKATVQNGLIGALEYSAVPQNSGVLNSSATQVVPAEVDERVVAGTGYFGTLPATREKGDLILPAALITSLQHTILTSPSAPTSGTYSLSGVRISNAAPQTKGIYIVNGQKVIR